MIWNWWYEKREKYAQIRHIKKTCQKFWNHIYQSGFMCAHRIEEIFMNWRERSERWKNVLITGIFTFFTQTWTIIQIHFLLFSLAASYFTLKLHHHSKWDKIIIHRASNGCKSFFGSLTPLREQKNLVHGDSQIIDLRLEATSDRSRHQSLNRWGASTKAFAFRQPWKWQKKN